MVIAIELNTEPNWGGSHQYAEYLAESIISFDRDNDKVIGLCANRYWRSWCRGKNIRYINYYEEESTELEQRFSCYFPRIAKEYNCKNTELGMIIEKYGIDLIVFTSQKTYMRSLKAKTMIPVHDLMHRYEPGFPEVSDSYEERERGYGSQAALANCILVDSVMGKEQFIESYKAKIGRQTHICELPFIVPRYIDAGDEEYIETPEKYVFYPAQFWKHKNHMNLVKAIKIVKHEISDINLVLVGSGKNSKREVENYIRNNGLSENVRIMGYVSDRQMVFLYRHAVMMVMPSYFGPTNIPPLEAMKLGCPVAVSGRYDMPRQIGDAGLVFAPDSPEEIADCIRKIWCDDKLRNALIMRGYEQAEKWGYPQFENRVHEIIKELMES